MTPRTLLAGATFAALASTTLAQTWTQVTPTSSPSTRRDSGMAYDLVNANVLLYGGLLSPTAINNETWSFDGTNWTQLTPATTPPARWGHRCVFDSRRARIVTFGGRSPTTTANARDTWEWNGVDWQQVVTLNAPSARAFYSMVFDERRGKVVLYGAQSGFPNGDQTWEYDGVDWTRVITATTPPGLETPAMTYDKARGVTVMFGGWYGVSPGVMYNTTYEYDGVDWRLVTTPNTPGARYRAACEYDDARGRVVMYGGYGSSTFTDTWEYDGTDWTMMSATGTARSTECATAYDQTRHQIYLFGGSGPTGVSQETWIYTGPRTAIFAPFGQGCTGSAGMPTLSGNAPVLGQNFVLTVGNLGANALGTLLLEGFSSTSLGGTVYLPLNLAAYGLAGCQLEIAPAVSVFLFAVNGTASLSFTVPNATGLLGLPYFTQAITPDAGAANGQVSMSNAGHAVLGN